MRSCLGGAEREAVAGLRDPHVAFSELAAEEQPTRQWIAARLHPLSYLLARPQPTFGSFAFSADDSFYARCDERHIQEAVDLVLSHLGVPRAAVGHVAFDPRLEVGGRITHGRTEAYLQFSPEHAAQPYEVGALVAHACAHVLAHRAHVPLAGGWEDEINTDLVAVLGGLGLLVAAPDPSVTFLDRENAAYAHAYVAQSLGFDAGLAEPVPPLRFGPPADTTWIRCPFCGRGMRVRGAAGHLSHVTCRYCASTTALDGRLCRIEEAPGP